MRLTIRRRDYPHDPILILASVQRIHSDGLHVICQCVNRRAGEMRFHSTVRLPLATVAEMHLTDDEGEPSDG